MNIASLFLLGVIAIILFLDYAKFGRGSKRLVVMELLIFAAGGVIIAIPELTARFAQLVGIGRGVDVVLYVTIIWLVRESIHTRFSRWREAERLTKLVRSLAVQSSRRRSASS